MVLSHCHSLEAKTKNLQGKGLPHHREASKGKSQSSMSINNTLSSTTT